MTQQAKNDLLRDIEVYRALADRDGSALVTEAVLADWIRRIDSIRTEGEAK